MPTSRPPAFWLFFPAAAIMAAAAVPLSVSAMLGSGWPAGFMNTGHDNEWLPPLPPIEPASTQR